MARKAKTRRTAKVADKKRRTRRPIATGAKTSVRAKGSALRKAHAPPRRVMTKKRSMPGVGMDELRGQIEKLARDNAMLVAQSKEVGEVAAAAAARIAELEGRVARLEKQLAGKATDAGNGQAESPPRPRRRRAHHREIDPGDAVPPGVAVEEPAALDLEAETARENLEHHFGGE